jgi:chromosome partitioning protein
MIPTIAFFQSMGGVGTTSLVYHLAWMYADLGHAVLAVDLDPRSRLTAAMVDAERLEALWNAGHEGALHRAIGQRMNGADELVAPYRERIGDKLELLVGDPGLSTLEDALADHWARARNGEPQAFFASTAFHQCIQAAALKAADGALGAHASAARAAREDWKHLAERIAQATWQPK